MGTPEAIARTADLGGASRDRTDDLYNAIVALSQLSYGPERARKGSGWGSLRQSRSGKFVHWRVDIDARALHRADRGGITRCSCGARSVSFAVRIGI